MTIDNQQTDRFERLFFWTGQVAHLIDRKQTLLPHQTEDRAPSLCGMIPVWPSIWFGRTEDDFEIAAFLPVCARCEYIKGVIARDESS